MTKFCGQEFGSSKKVKFRMQQFGTKGKMIIALLGVCDGTIYLWISPV
jgi:hypothetical protein